MVEANIKIIEDLKEVLNIINEDSQIKQFYTESKTDFTRGNLRVFRGSLY